MKFLLLLISFVCGYVTDPHGAPVPYATIYPTDDPAVGTASNAEGFFAFETDLPASAPVIISFIGYEKQQHPVAFFADTPTVVLREQPIALEETVVSAKASRHKNKRKEMAYLLHEVMLQMEADFPRENTRSRIVSDVRMNVEGEPWGMEQMIADIVCLPGMGRSGDSIQFHGIRCKRYTDAEIRRRADSVYLTATFENLNEQMPRRQQQSMPSVRTMVAAVDSGVATHRTLWQLGNVQLDFQHDTEDLSHWTVDRENDLQTVLTHTERHNYLGILKTDIVHHYILNSRTLSVERYSGRAEIWVNIPFGMKLNADQLRMLNLVNMQEDAIERFRLKKMHSVVYLNTIYNTREGKTVQQEKNLHSESELVGSRRTSREIGIELSATQRATRTEIRDVKPMPDSDITWRVERQMVEIY